jgi:hypothetical protein
MTKNALNRDALARYPVDYGTATRVGPHTLTTYDFENTDHYAALLSLAQAEPISLVYVDPPYGPGLASGYRTKAEMQERKADYAKLRRRLVALTLDTGAPFVIEMGNKWVEDWIADIVRLANNPRMPVTTASGTYYGKHPMTYIVGNAGNTTFDIARALTGVNDDASPGNVMDTLRLHSAALVFDPMCGRGCTARHATQRGLRFLGNELAPYRAAATLELLHNAIALD